MRLLIAAFIPEKMVWGDFYIQLQGLVLFGLYSAGIVSALIVAIDETWPSRFLIGLMQLRLM